MPTNKPQAKKLDGSPAVKPGRPPKLTRDLIKRIADVVRIGNYLDTAARYCGVSRVSFHEWMKKGHAQRRGIYRDFLNALEEAQSSADVRDHALIAKAAEKDWRAAVEHLRLRNQARYGVRRLEVSGPEGKPVSIEAHLDEETVVAACRALAAQRGEE